ncbi:hypothetical protein [Microbacterium sp. NPDC087589]|uniref:hypothetical protein n=1 Tax=Microbacterium sp. NPDC087589 TaxID=3364191 RepID=UPI003811BA30
MTAVGLLATIPGAAGSGEADTGGRASADSGSLFGDALAAAGRTLDDASATETTMLAPAREGGLTAEASTAPDRTIDPQAAIAAMTHLVAWSAPVTPGPAPTATPVPTSETAVPGETASTASDMTVQITPGAAEVSPADPVSGVVEADAAAAVPADAESAPASAPTSVPASALASAPASAAVGGESRGELRTQQERPPGEVREVGVDTAAVPREPASGGADPLPSDPVAAALRPEPHTRQTLPAIPSVVGVPVPGVGGSSEQQMSSDAGDQAQGSQPVPATTPLAPVAPVAPSVATVTAAPSPDAAATMNRAVAAQVAPVVVSIAQRPMGSHQLTMTVNPDSLGPVTVRAHITASGEVQVELSGATDAGRDALRTMLVDLRRDLAAVMPHATLSVNHGASADASGDRGQQAAGDAPTGQGADDREANRGRPDHRRGAEQAPDLPRTIQTMPSAASGAGLDIFA